MREGCGRLDLPPMRHTYICVFVVGAMAASSHRDLHVLSLHLCDCLPRIFIRSMLLPMRFFVKKSQIDSVGRHGYRLENRTNACGHIATVRGVLSNARRNLVKGFSPTHAIRHLLLAVADILGSGDVMVYKMCTAIAQTKEFTARIQALDIPNELKCGCSTFGFVRRGRSACRIQDGLKDGQGDR